MIKSPRLLLSNILNALLLLLAFESFSATALLPANETDKLALLALKDRILVDPLRVMDSWNESFHFCNWWGVTCSKQYQGRVTELSLGGQKLVGSLPPDIGNLSFLQLFDLGQNAFTGEIPQEIGNLFQLIALGLNNNRFYGKIPRNLSLCSSLEFIDLSYNSLTGEIPIELENLSNYLGSLNLFNNQLIGSIPKWLGNASSLIELSLGDIKFHGSIPDELGRLGKLQKLHLAVNSLSGKVPFSIYNLSSLNFLSMAANKIHGTLPLDIGFTLPNLRELYVGENQFYGEIPLSLFNATKLEIVDMGSNTFSGVVPSDLGSLTNLKYLSLARNQLKTAVGEGLSFITSLTNCTNLEVLQLTDNHFEGELPTSIANFSTKLRYLFIGSSRISGKIPEQIGNLAGLTELEIACTEVTGDIPSSIANLKLFKLHLYSNRLSGSIPSSIGNLTQLQRLFLNDNNLSGSVPPSLGNCLQIEYLYLDSNNLSGNIPKQLFSLSRVLELLLGNNSFDGQLPVEIGKLTSVVNLSVAYNQLSGEIPSTLGSCSSLRKLWMGHNMFEGEIPSSFKDLKNLELLALFQNNLSGKILEYFQNFTFLEGLELSLNNFVGEIPTGGIFGNTSAFWVFGNQRLCGGVQLLGFPRCEGTRRKGKFHLLKVGISVAIVCSVVLLLAVVLLVILSHRRKLSRRRRAASTELQLPEGFPKISYAELRNATNDFSSSNLLGEGSFGSVYRGTLGQDRMSVAVKVLNLSQKGASKSFVAECEALKRIRHRNLIKIVTVCSSIDHKGTDFMALVYEFMQNGSLEEWLHPKDEDRDSGRNLSFIQRLNIAIEVASAVEYLHDHCLPPIVYGDLKPSNDLLDEDMVGHVGDFGLARFLTSSHPNQSSSIGMEGTIGYIAPEYGMNQKASKLGDVYGFGILLLEMITGYRCNL